MTEPTTVHIVLSGALAITLGLLVRALCVRRVPTLRSVIQVEKERIVRVCNRTVHESSVMPPDFLERLAMADARGLRRVSSWPRL